MGESTDEPEDAPRGFASSPCMMQELDPETLQFKSGPGAPRGQPALPGPPAVGRAERSEQGRIEFLLRRDGREATRVWVERTLGIYRQALADAGSHARDPVYRPRFEQSVREFEAWLAGRQD